CALTPHQNLPEKTCILRNTPLREQRTYPLLDLSKRRRPQRKRLLNRRGPRPRHSNHGCPWIQKSANKATVMLDTEHCCAPPSASWQQRCLQPTHSRWSARERTGRSVC